MRTTINTASLTSLLGCLILFGASCGPGAEEDANAESNNVTQNKAENKSPGGNNAMTPEKMKEAKDEIDPGVTCMQQGCASDKWQRALPSRDTVSISFGGSGTSAPRNLSFDAAGFATGEISSDYQDLEAYIGEINDLLDDVFLTIEEVGALPPEVEEDGFARWRLTQDGYDVIVEVATEDEVNYEIWVDAVDSGVLFERAESGLTGSMVLDEDGNKESFDFLLDLEDFGVFDDIEVTSEIAITARPFDGGLFVYTYDFVELDAQSASLAETTYWVFEPGSGAIEHSYVADDGFEASAGELYGRWDVDGGRLDGFVGILDAQGDVWNVVTSNCWGGGGIETFDGIIAIDAGEVYAETLGEPGDCLFEVLDGNPDPILEIAEIFETYGWENADEYGNFPDEVELGEWDDDFEPDLGNNDPGLCLEDASFIEDEVAFCDEATIDLSSECSTDGADLLTACADAIELAAECEGLLDVACSFLYE